MPLGSCPRCHRYKVLRGDAACLDCTTELVHRYPPPKFGPKREGPQPTVCVACDDALDKRRQENGLEWCLPCALNLGRVQAGLPPLDLTKRGSSRKRRVKRYPGRSP